MKTTGPSTEQRISFRCPIVRRDATGCMEVGRRRLRVQLLEESAGGFAVLLEDSGEIAIDQTAVLRIASGHFEVRIVHVRPVGGADGDAAQPGLCVGLERLRELDWDACQSGFRRWLGWLSPTFHRTVLPLTRFLLTGMAVTAFVAGVAWLLSRPQSPLSDWGVVTGKRVNGWQPRARESVSHAKVLDSDDSIGEGEKSGVGSKRPLTPRETGGLLREHASVQLRDEIRTAQGAEVLLLPAVVRYLELSETQRRQIRELVEATRVLQLRMGGGTTPQLQEDALRQQVAREQAIQLLTPAQSERWREICPP